MGLWLRIDDDPDGFSATTVRATRTQAINGALGRVLGLWMFTCWSVVAAIEYGSWALTVLAGCALVATFTGAYRSMRRGEVSFGAVGVRSRRAHVPWTHVDAVEVVDRWLKRRVVVRLHRRGPWDRRTLVLPLPTSWTGDVDGGRALAARMEAARRG